MNDSKKINKYRKNNEFYIEIINKIENIKLKLLKNNYGKLFKSCLKIINDNENYFIMAKKDRRKLNREHIENFYLKIDIVNNKELSEIIEQFHSHYYLSYDFTKFMGNSKEEEIFKKLSNYQKKNYQKVLYLNYPYIFKKITDFLKFNSQLKNNINDIENTTLSIVLNSIIKFDTNKNVKFVTYLGYWIKYGIEEEISFFNKNNQTKFNNLSNFRFSNADFYDKQIQNRLNLETNSKIYKQLKIIQKNYYKLIIKKLITMNMNFFAIFNVDINNLTLVEFVNNLNYFITNKENRTILFNYFKRTENNFFFKNNNIIVYNNKTSLYKCLNLLLLNDFHYKTVPIYNIDDINQNNLTFEIDYHEDDFFFKLKKFLTLSECKILDDFYKQEIEELPEELKSKLINFIKIDKDKNYYINKEIK